MTSLFSAGTENIGFSNEEIYSKGIQRCRPQTEWS